MSDSETTEDQARLPSSDPCDYPTYGAWFEALRVRGDIERQRHTMSAESV